MSLPGARKALIGSAIAAMLLGAGCSSGGASLTAPPVNERAAVRPAQPTVPPAGAGGYGAPAAPPSATTNALKKTSIGNLNDVVTDAQGYTLYRFDKDTNKPATSSCVGQCEQNWPPALIDPNADISTLTVEGVDKSKLGVLQRADGKKQLTISNWPVYRFAKDTAPGQANGEAAQGSWWVVASNGVRSKDKPAAPPAGTTIIRAMDVAPFGKVVTDSEGFTLYRFDKDTPKPPVSNCNGDCAAQWPPVLADGNLITDGVDQSLIGTVTRADGTKQVTLAGWPLYRYVKDTLQCQSNGEGVGGVWFVTALDGKKAKDKIAQ
jgi:predicted lipoprotein with Yx(FWY)xxD motif